jgi:hypothetical protein
MSGIQIGYKKAKKGQKQQKRRKIKFDNPPNLLAFLVGARGFEPPTP